MDYCFHVSSDKEMVLRRLLSSRIPLSAQTCNERILRSKAPCFYAREESVFLPLQEKSNFSVAENKFIFIFLHSRKVSDSTTRKRAVQKIREIFLSITESLIYTNVL
eukprot:TRINITY_DN1202_c1_g1_i1.p4 TRINITY_DN1202_c1_g1~~TRINITY_DN1202_c1_g1_i1.p4  ORF type:complete len:107 (+),score=13.59 TRINITY_DN1202_c1_g1_i1:1709-2029(+)